MKTYIGIGSQAEGKFAKKEYTAETKLQQVRSERRQRKGRSFSSRNKGNSKGFPKGSRERSPERRKREREGERERERERERADESKVVRVG